MTGAGGSTFDSGSGSNGGSGSRELLLRGPSLRRIAIKTLRAQRSSSTSPTDADRGGDDSLSHGFLEPTTKEYETEMQSHISTVGEEVEAVRSASPPPTATAAWPADALLRGLFFPKDVDYRHPLFPHSNSGSSPTKGSLGVGRREREGGIGAGDMAQCDTRDSRERQRLLPREDSELGLAAVSIVSGTPSKQKSRCSAEALAAAVSGSPASSSLALCFAADGSSLSSNSSSSSSSSRGAVGAKLSAAVAAVTAGLNARDGWSLSVSSAMLYCSVGLAMGFINKATLMRWPFSNSLLTLQMAASVAIVYLLGFLRLVEVRPLDSSTALSLSGVVFFYNANVAFALAAVQALSIPMYHVLKRLTPVMVLAAKFAMGEGLPPRPVVASVAAVVAGCLLSGAGDLSFDAKGYLWAIVSCMLQTAYLLLVERSGSQKAGLTSNELLVYNSVLSLPVLALLTVATGEAQRSVPRLVEFFVTGDSFLWIFLLSLVAGVLLNFSLFFCTVNNSALTTTIVGTLRSTLGTTLGFFVLGGVKATPLIIAGCTTNTLGGVGYTLAKLQKKRQQQQQLPTEAEKAEAIPLFSRLRQGSEKDLVAVEEAEAGRKGDCGYRG